MKRRFSVGQVLSITTGKLLCDIGQVYEILDFLLSDKHFTHQLPRACRDALPFVHEQLPWTKDVTCDEVTPTNFKKRLAHYSKTFGEFHELAPITRADELHRDPLAELEEMAPGRVIPVVLP